MLSGLSPQPHRAPSGESVHMAAPSTDGGHRRCWNGLPVLDGRASGELCDRGAVPGPVPPQTTTRNHRLNKKSHSSAGHDFLTASFVKIGARASPDQIRTSLADV